MKRKKEFFYLKSSFSHHLFEKKKLLREHFLYSSFSLKTKKVVGQMS